MTEVPARGLMCAGSIGFAIGVFGARTIQRLGERLSPGSSLELLVLAAMLIGLALGLAIPNYLARWFARLPRDERDGPAPALCTGRASLESSAHPTTTQLQTLCSGALVMSGLCLMLVHHLEAPLAWLYDSALHSFHWTPLTSRVLEFALASGYVVLPCGSLGIALNCTQRVTLFNTSNAALSGGIMLLGLAVGSAAWRMLAALPADALEMVAALVPLFSGAAALMLGEPRRSVVEPEKYVPDFTERWRMLLSGVLCVTCFLTSYYVVTWQHLMEFAGVPWGGSAGVGSVGAGLLLSATAGGRSWRSMRGIAVACMLASMATAVAAVVGGGALAADIGDSQSRSAAQPGMGCIWTSTALMGLVAGLILAAVVERSPQAQGGAVFCCIAACISAGAACVGSLPMVVDQSGSFHVFVIISLTWILAGGIVLIHEPGFRIPHRVPQTALMIGVLGFLTLVLPAQAMPWSSLSRRIAQVSSGSLKMVRHADGAGVLMERFRETEDRLMSLDAMLRLMKLTKEKHSAILLTWPSTSGRPSLERMRLAVVRAARARLRPDGVLLVRFADEDSTALAAGSALVR